MSRDLDNLKRVFQKLQVRYGEADPIVLQVKQEIESREVVAVKYTQWLTTYRQRLAERRGWTPLSADAGGASRPASSQACT